LANALFSQGRSFEALEEYDRAIAIFNNPLAYFLKGRTLVEVSNSLYDGGHAIYFQKEAYPILKYVYECKDVLFDEGRRNFLDASTNCRGFVSHFDQHFVSICEEFQHIWEIKEGASI
jgi:tetratricopeptide (TPR) repeat protein